MLVNSNIKKIFGNKYYDIVINYINLIQEVISSYDVVIIMARKAYCFYTAITKAGLIKQNPDCTILSSRSLTYQGLTLTNKRVAIIEDVAVQGRSLLDVVAMNALEDITPDIYLAACKKDFPSKFEKETAQLKLSQPYLIMGDKELLEFATLITNYIICEMVPYNVDFPIYRFRFENIDELYTILNQYGYCSISSLLNNNEKNVDEGIIHFDDIYENPDIPKDTTIKIRTYIDTLRNTCVIMPIVLLPELSFEYITDLFNNKFSDLNDIVSSSEKSIEIKNMYKVLQYIIGRDKIYAFFKNSLLNSFKIERINDEVAIFSKKISEEIFYRQSPNSLYIKETTSSSELYHALGAAYDLIIKNCNLNTEYNFEFKNEYISFDDIVSQLVFFGFEKEKAKLFASLMLDVFIDNGVVVPRMHLSDNKIIRLYKFGEVARLTVHDFELFADVLYRYSDEEERLIGKTEMEKITVLFFKKYNNCFNTDNNEAESYRICFSKFGPRISSSEYRYKVNQGTALTEKFEESGYIREVGGEINVSTNSSSNKSISVNSRVLFAHGLSQIHHYYINAQSKDPKNDVFNYIDNYTRLLTLFSIGDDENDKILSLIAEVDLIRTIKVFNTEKIKTYFYALQKNIDGVLSGVWKYFCYIREENLLRDIFELLNIHSEQENALYVISQTINTNFDVFESKNKQYIETLGLYLCRVAIFNEYCCNYYNISLHKDYNGTPYQKLFKNSSLYNTLNNEYENIFNQDKDSVEKFIKEEVYRLYVLACKHMDQFKVYEATNTLSSSEYNECYVLFNADKNKGVNTNCSIKSYAYKNLLIFPISRNSKKDVLQKILESIDDINIKVIYYYSQDKSVFTTLSDCYGELFKYDLMKISKKISELNPSSNYEFFVVNNREEIVFSEMISAFNGFEYYGEHKNIITEQGYSIDRCYYNKKAKEKKYMEIHIEKNYGNIAERHYGDNFLKIGADNISSELKTAEEICEDPVIKEKLNEAIDANESGNESKLKSALKWLAQNAFDFIKSVSSDVLTNLISGQLQG